MVIAFHDGGKEVFDEIAQLRAERQRQARRRETVNGIMSEAERIGIELHADIRVQIRAQVQPFEREINEMRDAVLSAQADRNEISLELERIAREATCLLDSISPAPPSIKA